VAHSAKKPWTKPEVTQFETLEELLDRYSKEMPHAEFDELVKRAEQLQRSRRRAEHFQLPKSSKK
jgi:hypothetical protein